MFDLENTFFGGQNEIAKLNLYTRYLFGEVYMRSGSVLAAKPCLSENTVPQVDYKFTLAFNDAEWNLGSGDYLITTNTVKNAECFYPDRHLVEMRGVGVIFKPALNKTITVDMPFIGEGGLVSAGEGTVKLVRGAYSFKGLLDVRSGTVDLRESAPVAKASLRGPGRVLGGDFGVLTLRLGGGESFESKAPVLDGVKAGRVTVDLGVQKPGAFDIEALSNVTVATYLNTPPDVGHWRVVGTGLKRVRGEFTVADGKVMMRVVPTGMAVIVR
jgi:hypothetical protein